MRRRAGDMGYSRRERSTSKRDAVPAAAENGRPAPQCRKKIPARVGLRRNIVQPEGGEMTDAVQIYGKAG